MGYFRTVLQSKEANDAISYGFQTWFATGDLSKGIDAMFAMADRNGSLAKARVAALLDILGAIFSPK